MTHPRTASASSAKVTAATYSICSNTLLVALKVAAGAMTGSVSILSEAAHSANDLLASWIAFFAVRQSDRPADGTHPYGHGKIEGLSGMAEALLIFAAAAYIVFEAVRKLLSPPEALDVGIGLWVMALSVVLNSAVSSYLFRRARETDSLALLADAEHLRTDVFTSVGVLVGLALVQLTGKVWLDPVAALVVAVMIVRAAWRLTRGALNPLMDAQLPEEELNAVRRVLEGEEAVLAYHKLRTRKSGSMRHVDAHILVDDTLSLVEAHALTEALEDRIRDSLANCEVTLHTEPYEEETRHQRERHGSPDAAEASGSSVNVAKRERTR